VADDLVAAYLDLRTHATGYSTFRLDDEELTLIASGSDGDPVAAAISHDGSTPYIAESGAVDVIPLP
jgi:hypothetical protein